MGAETDRTFRLVMEQYQNKVFRLCRAMLPDEGLAEDTAQEVFVRVWKALPRYRGESSLSTWIYTITRSACRTRIKREAARRTVPLAEAEIGHQAGDVHAGQPDLERLLAGLPERHRQVIVMFYFEEKSYEEVAAMLDLPLGTVKTYLHRARRELSAAMESLYGMRRV